MGRLISVSRVVVLKIEEAAGRLSYDNYRYGCCTPSDPAVQTASVWEGLGSYVSVARPLGLASVYSWLAGCPFQSLQKSLHVRLAADTVARGAGVQALLLECAVRPRASHLTSLGVGFPTAPFPPHLARINN